MTTFPKPVKDRLAATIKVAKTTLARHDQQINDIKTKAANVAKTVAQNVSDIANNTILITNVGGTVDTLSTTVANLGGTVTDLQTQVNNLLSGNVTIGGSLTVEDNVHIDGNLYGQGGVLSIGDAVSLDQALTSTANINTSGNMNAPDGHMDAGNYNGASFPCGDVSAPGDGASLSATATAVTNLIHSLKNAGIMN